MPPHEGESCTLVYRTHDLGLAAYLATMGFSCQRTLEWETTVGKKRRATFVLSLCGDNDKGSSEDNEVYLDTLLDHWYNNKPDCPAKLYKAYLDSLKMLLRESRDQMVSSDDPQQNETE